VGLFPLEWSGYVAEELLHGASEFMTSVAKNNFQDMTELTYFFIFLRTKYIDQTVLMPYSSILKNFSAWFVQLWAESLGKINEAGLSTGLTPIPAYGPADQHAQLQFFTQGPLQKLILFIEVQKNSQDFSLLSPIKGFGLDELNSVSLNQLIQAQLYGTMSSLQRLGRPFMHLKIPELSLRDVGELTLFFQVLTASVGMALNVDPFDQPGVELSKKLTWDFLKTGKSPLEL
jgi:glucose-6-phosphate isomerase